MSGLQAILNFSVSIASGATLSSAVDLGTDSYGALSLCIPTMTSGTDIYLRGSHDGATFRRTYSEAGSALTYASTVTQANVGVSGFNYRYLKIELSTAMTAASAGFDIVIS